MKLEVHILSYNEEDFMPFALRHWTSVASRVVVHDTPGTDRTRDICREFGVEVRDFVTDGVNDKLFKERKQTCWHGSDADWVACVDCDELLYCPGGFFDTLEAYAKEGIPVVKPHGYEMFSDVFPTTDRQVYDEVKMGAPENEWYAKSVLFSPKLVRAIEFSAGAHETWAELHDGTKWNSRRAPATPPTLFLHFHHIGPLQRMAERYRRQQARHSKTNIQNKWGNFDDPMKHAKDKRAKIVPHLVQVID